MSIFETNEHLRALFFARSSCGKSMVKILPLTPRTDRARVEGSSVSFAGSGVLAVAGLPVGIADLAALECLFQREGQRNEHDRNG
jgi:hypothetical protein